MNRINLHQIQEMVKEVNELNGWTPTEQELKCKWFFPGKLMLSVSEYVEALEGYRNQDDGNVKEELADCAIRLLDICNNLEFYDLEEEIIKKLDKNMKRGHRHGGKTGKGKIV